MTSQFDNPKQSQRSERAHNTTIRFSFWLDSDAEGEVDETYNDNEAIKQIELVSGVILKT